MGQIHSSPLALLLAGHRQPERLTHMNNEDEEYRHLPDWLLFEVFDRLPPQSLFRCAFVSKRWLSFISDPLFATPYFARYRSLWSSPPPQWTILFRFHPPTMSHGNAFTDQYPVEVKGQHYVTSHHPELRSLDFPLSFAPSDSPNSCHLNLAPPQERSHIIARGTELILCLDHYNTTCLSFYVGNLFTNQWAAPPPAPGHPDFRDVLGAGVVGNFESYKVVLFLLSYGMARSARFDVFASETGEWKREEVEVPSPFCFKDSISQKRAVVYKGILHWLDEKTGNIMAYNPTEETCHLMSLPMGRTLGRFQSGMNSVFDVCGGQLRCFLVSDLVMKPFLFTSWTCWVLEDYKNGQWRLENGGEKREIDSGDAHYMLHSIRRLLVPIAFHPLDLDIVYFWQRGHILSFSLSRKKFQEECYTIPRVGQLTWASVMPMVLPRWLAPPPPCITPDKEKRRWHGAYMDEDIRRRVCKVAHGMQSKMEELARLALIAVGEKIGQI